MMRETDITHAPSPVGESKAKPRILIIDNSPAVTGALKSVLRSSASLSNDFDFEFILPQNSQAASYIAANVSWDVRHMPFVELSRRWIDWILYLPALFANARRLIKRLKSRQISLIHSNDLYNLVPVVIRMMGVRTPYIVHIRFMPDRFPPSLFRFWFRLHARYAETIVAVSNSVARQLPKSPKVVVIHHGISSWTTLGSLSQQRQNGFVMLYLANFVSGKGQNFAIAAFAAISQQLPGWKLRFVGGDLGMDKNRAFRESLVAESIRLGLAGKTEFAGFTSNVELEYRNADIVLNFSESESFSMTCLEALLFGKALIATDCGGPSEIVDHGQTGLIVPNRDVSAMKAAMLKLANDAAMRERFGHAAREAVSKRFSMEATSMRMKEVYNAALSTR